ncbi:MAG: SDR family oxidoreductase [Acidimicrobiales bacterium]|nr:SDR family oxidoreductase [Acidimicrobiales bacterium]
MSNDNSLAGVAALVTGGGSGIGMACARRLVADGAAVTLMGRRIDKLRDAARALSAEAGGGAQVTFHSGDVANEDHVASAVAAAAETTGRLGVVVAAAGTGGGAGPVGSIDIEQWNRTLAVNLTGVLACIKHGSNAMTQGGSIVAVSSIAGGLTHRLMTTYCVSKAGLEMLVRNAADELGAKGIRVNAVRPGLVPTELADALASNPAIVDEYLSLMPLGRLGQPQDVADLVGFLAGPQSSWITGQIVGVDGGHTLRRGPDITVGFSGRQ